MGVPAPLPEVTGNLRRRKAILVVWECGTWVTCVSISHPSLTPYSPLTHILARVRVADLVRCLRVRPLKPNARALTNPSLVIACGASLVTLTHPVTSVTSSWATCVTPDSSLCLIGNPFSLRHQHLLMASSSLRQLTSSSIFFYLAYSSTSASSSASVAASVYVIPILPGLCH